MNENFEKYIKDLSPELQQKARECKTTEELIEFLADNDLELPEDALEAVAGGCGTADTKKAYCIYCGSRALLSSLHGDSTHWCPKCVKPLSYNNGEVELR
ncbi:MAG: hypothetical protein J6O40_05895 [Ruminococcus sp.]|nr:hypothetical protein [Ruminococcus sp.]